MKAKKWFEQMSFEDLVVWWGQYGRPAQAAFYRAVPRRAARVEIARRGWLGNQNVVLNKGFAERNR